LGTRLGRRQRVSLARARGHGSSAVGGFDWAYALPSVSPSDLAVLAIVVGGRLLLPLAIIRYPLPAIVACLLLDAVDQTIFQTFTTLPLDGYQGYDKALDIYYLSIAYISTLRNWTSHFAIEIARFLLYYRLIGVVLFEITQVRPLLLIFPNTFEYFFIFYEAVRVRWDPRRMSRGVLIGATAFIWIFIKLPQEWWIHVAQLDLSDTIKRILGGTPESPWGELVAANIGLIAAVAVAAVLLLVAVWWVITRKLPPADRPFTIDADADRVQPDPSRLAAVLTEMRSRVFDRELFEKTALVSLVSIIFTLGLGMNASPLEVAVAVVVVIVINTAVSEWLGRRGVSWQTVVRQFMAMLAINAAILLVVSVLLPGRLDPVTSAFFLFLLSLIVTLYDRYRPEFLARFPQESGAAA
jgi:hypothetical protein